MQTFLTGLVAVLIVLAAILVPTTYNALTFMFVSMWIAVIGLYVAYLIALRAENKQLDQMEKELNQEACGMLRH